MVVNVIGVQCLMNISDKLILQEILPVYLSMTSKRDFWMKLITTHYKKKSLCLIGTGRLDWNLQYWLHWTNFTPLSSHMTGMLISPDCSDTPGPFLWPRSLPMTSCSSTPVLCLFMQITKCYSELSVILCWNSFIQDIVTQYYPWFSCE